MNVLAIGGHFDDVEIGCGGTISKHVRNGDRVFVYVVTRSNYTDYNGHVMRDVETARREGQEAARILGYELICGDFETKEVAFNHRLVESINKVVDDHAIDLIYTHWSGDVHQDHQAIGQATLAAGRKVNRLLSYRSNLYINAFPFHPNFYVDISADIDRKFEAILAHRTEVAKFGSEWLDFWKNDARNNGQIMGVAYAEAFYLIKYFA